MLSSVPLHLNLFLINSKLNLSKINLLDASNDISITIVIPIAKFNVACDGSIKDCMMFELTKK